jgi:zinc finger CCHC domain-containing protein 9
MGKVQRFKKTHLEPSGFNVKPIQPKDRKQIASRKRKERREKSKFSKVQCFNCRKIGHAVNSCPESKEQAICYACGSLEHTLAKCSKRGQGLPFAKCFVCKETGHLSGQCPRNEHGLYPNGGGCRFCGDVRHLAKDCNPLDKNKTITLGVVDANQGGDDDDVHITLAALDEERPTQKLKTAKKVVMFK